MPNDLEQIYATKIVQLEAENHRLRQKLHDRDLEIISLSHELMLERESQKCDSCEPFLDEPE